MGNVRSQRNTFIFFDTPDCAVIGSGVLGAAPAGSADPASILDIRSISGRGANQGGGSGMLAPVPGSNAAAPGGGSPQSGMNVRGSTPTTMGAGRASVFY